MSDHSKACQESEGSECIGMGWDCRQNDEDTCYRCDLDLETCTCANIPDEEDITCPDPGGPFHYAGKKIADTRAELRAWMEREGYFPDVWFISDHGNAHPLTDIHDSTKD
jgi:hypothetical protein